MNSDRSTVNKSERDRQNTSTVLIVDDEQHVRDVIKALLVEQGYNLAFAKNGTEALTLADELTPDLLLLDIMMPDMDGYEVCERLRADPHLADVPIIMITALDDPDSCLRGIKAGADDFVTKPFNGTELQARVRTITRLNRYRRLLQEQAFRQQAEAEVHRRNRELSLLNRVITAAASTFDIRETLTVACQTLADAFELTRATAILLGEDQTMFDLVVEYATPSRTSECEENAQRRKPSQSDKATNAKFRTDETRMLSNNSQRGRASTAHPADHLKPSWDASSQALHNESSIPPLSKLLTKYLRIDKAPLFISNDRKDRRLAPIVNLMQKHGLGSLLIVPVMRREQLIGFIEMITTERHHFSDHDVTVAQSVATAVGQAIETAQLHHTLQQHADNLEETVAQRTRELQIERDRTQSILEALGEAIIVTDMAGTIRYANPEVELQTGYSSQEILGKSWGLWHSDQQPTEIYKRLEDTLQAGQTWRGEVTLRRKDGSAYDAALTVAPFLSHNRDRLNGFVSVQRDITPLKEAERAKNKFVSNVSHELRTPLSIITLVSDNLETLYDRLDDAGRIELIRDIQKQAEVLNELINDVLEISRIDSNRISMERQEQNLAQLAHDELNKLLPLAQEKSLSLRMAGVDRAPVWGHSGHLRQTIRNLLNNAIKYTPNNGQIICECATLSAPVPNNNTFSKMGWPGVSDLSPGRWVALRVVDTGIGINLDELPHVFERFYRVEAQQSIRGTGLGLPIVRELVELHGGHVDVASSLGQGSSFAIYLPLMS